MLRNFGLKAILLVVMVALCLGVPIVNAEGAVLNWTSPTTEHLMSVFMVSADDGWAVGFDGTIIRWTGTEWIPEFPTIVLMPLLISLTLVVVIVAKIASKKHRKPLLPSKTLL
ncbi:MAG: hypothetical protein OEW62_03330 [Candidatus Bathyarchaeota archaeon]|nr:hypothetical protein [Candidatus Bathyarchaeota archaeon]MDH5746100.1 hypothetical protein [Candidatus Bathyarchaeota archaeon]